jgi:hypothetical protein
MKILPEALKFARRRSESNGNRAAPSKRAPFEWKHMQLCYLKKDTDQVAITIRNKQTEEMIRQIGARTGEGPSSVIKRLAEEALAAAPGKISQAEFERRMAAWDDLMADVPRFTKAEQQAIQDETDHLFDYLDEDAAPAPGQKPEAAE